MDTHPSTSRFWEKVTTSDIHSYNDTPCLEWTACIDIEGYGRFWLNGKPEYAHRVSYELLKDKIPDDLVINHLCRNRCCVNSNHLEILTNIENIQKGENANRNKTHCQQGHEYTEENTYYRKNVIGRKCKICNLIYVSQSRHRKNS